MDAAERRLAEVDGSSAAARGDLLLVRENSSRGFRCPQAYPRASHKVWGFDTELPESLDATIRYRFPSITASLSSR